MFERMKMRCEKIEPNNGTFSMTLIKRAEYSDPKSQEELVQIRFLQMRGPFEVGGDYWIEIYPV